MYFNVVTAARQLKMYHTTSALYGNTMAAAGLFTPSTAGAPIYVGWDGEGTNPNYEPMFAAYTLDYTAPTSTVTTHSNNSQYNSITSIAGTATDGALNAANTALVRKVQISIQDLTYSASYYMVSNSTWVWVQTWNDNTSFTQGSPDASWSFTVLNASFTTNHTYLIQTRAIDYNKCSVPGDAYSSRWSMTQHRPQAKSRSPVTLSGNNGYYQNGAIGSATLVSSDTTPGAVYKVYPNLSKLIGVTP